MAIIWQQARMLLQSPFHLIEAGKIDEKVLTSHVYAGTMSFIIRKNFRKHLQHELRKIIDNLNQLEQGAHTRYVIDLLQYVLNIAEGQQNVAELLTIVHQKMPSNLEKTMTSLADRLTQKGRIEGKLEGQFETANNMLQEGCDLSFIAKITKLPLEKIIALQKKH